MAENEKPSEIQDLRKHLFETLDSLKKKEIDLDQAKAVTNIAQAIIGTAKVEVDFINAVGGIATGTGFIPLEPKKPDQKALESGQENENE